MQNISTTRFLVLFFGLSLPLLGFSQEENFQLRIDSVYTQGGQEVCVPVYASNFEGVMGLQFAMQWDANKLAYSSLANLSESPLSLRETNFGLSLTDEGKLLFSWTSPPASGTGLTLPDDTEIFQLCLQAVAGQGQVPITADTATLPSEVTYSDFSASDFPIEDGFVYIEDGLPEIDPPVLLEMGSITADSGAVACLNVRTLNFDSLSSLNYSLQWDANVAQFTEAQNLNLPGLSQNGFQAIGNNQLDINWQSEIPSGISLPPQAVAYSLCFQLVGEGGGSTTIEGIGMPEAHDIGGDTIEVRVGEGELNITQSLSGNDSDVQFFIPDATVVPGDSVCLPIIANDFENILSTQYTLAWDPSTLAFDSLRNFTVPDMDASDFGISRAESGILRVGWFDPHVQGITLQDFTTLYEVCFTAVGGLGASTTVEFRDTPLMIEVIQQLENGGETLSVGFQNSFVQIGERAAFVLPGDTDVNDRVNHFDLLNIGLGFGQNGPERANATIEPTAQFADDWATATPESTINFKHADTNGDGTINAADTLALVQNWGFAPDFFTPIQEEDELIPLDGRSEKPPFFVLPDTLQPGATYELPVILGDENNPAENVYGLAFSLVFDTSVIVSGSVRMSFEESWLGEDLLHVQREFSDNGHLDVAITRLDGQNITGSDAIGQLHLTIEDVIFFDDNPVDDRSGNGEYELRFDIENVRLIDREENEQEVTATESVTLIETEVTSVAPVIRKEGLTIYPNPVREVLHVQVAQGSVEAIRVFDSMGKLVQMLPAATQLSVQQLRPGQYTIHIITGKNVLVSQFIVVH